MAMVKAIGANLQTGVTSSGIGGVHEQSATKSSAGELKDYKDRNGNPVSVYVTDRHKEYSFEAILESSVADKEIGERATVAGISGVVTKWDVTETNDDVKKVSVGIRTYPGLT